MSTQPPEIIPLGYRLPITGPSGAKPKRVIFRLLDLAWNKDKEHLDIVYVNNNDQVMSKSITEVIDDLTPYKEKGRFIDPPKSPLDLNCKEDCYIVFMLSKKRNWQFSMDGDCFSTKEPEGSKYSDLNHVMSNRNKYGPGLKIPSGCRLLYFRAKCDDSTNNDGFNLNIDMVLDSVRNNQTGQMEPRKTKIIFDPDIRNPGGSGPGSLEE